MVKIDRAEIVSSLKRDLQGLHKFNPDYIFLTDTSAVPAGYILKEAWKTAFPSDKAPVFYRVDPEALKDGLESHRHEINKFFRKRLRKKNARVFVYDEDSLHGGSPRAILQLLKYPEKFGLDPEIRCEEVKMVTPYKLGDSSKKELYESYQLNDIKGSRPVRTISISGGNVVKKKDKWIPRSEWNSAGLQGAYPEWRLRSKLLTEEEWNKRTKQEYLPHELRESTRSGAVNYFRQIGKDVAFELKKEVQQNKNLEDRINLVIAMGAVISSILISSSSITGNVVATTHLSYSSTLSLALFLVGALSTYLYLKSK